ncbi:MAG: hypothetical protein ACI89T_000094 [Cognaticolwellia sp.]|jgi:hypothetical protein
MPKQKIQECKSLLLDTIEQENTYKMQGNKVELMQKLAETYYQLGVFDTAYLTLKPANSL